jgi:hypothetical protein
MEQYADTPVGVNYHNGNLHFTFATVRSDFGTDGVSLVSPEF